MKKNILDELTQLDDEIMDELIKTAPSPDETQKKRIAQMCAAKSMTEDGDSVAGTEIIHRRTPGRYAAAAAALLVIVGGGAGVYSLHRNLRPDARNAADNSDYSIAATPAADVTEEQGVSADTSAEESTLIQEVDPIKVTVPTDGKITEHMIPADSNGSLVVTLPAHDSDKRLPEDIPYYNDNDAETVTVTTEEVTTSPKEIAVPYTDPAPSEIPDEDDPRFLEGPYLTTEPTVDEPPPKTDEPATEPIVTRPYFTIYGYWNSDYGPGGSQIYFGRDFIGNFYDSNTCSGFTFKYLLADDHIELRLLNADGSLSETNYGTAYFTWERGDALTLTWKEGSPIRQDQLVEHLVRNYSDAMAE